MNLNAILLTTVSAMLVLGLVSCENAGTASAGHPTGTGPFDRRGNYVEAWADNPAKWRGGDRMPTPPRTTTPQPTRPAPVVASNQQRTQQARTTTATPPTTATTRPRPAAPRPAATQVKRYTVRRGDTLSAIARRNNTTVAALRRANGISGDLIRVGQVLRLP